MTVAQERSADAVAKMRDALYKRRKEEFKVATIEMIKALGEVAGYYLFIDEQYGEGDKPEWIPACGESVYQQMIDIDGSITVQVREAGKVAGYLHFLYQSVGSPAELLYDWSWDRGERGEAFNNHIEAVTIAADAIWLGE